MMATMRVVYILLHFPYLTETFVAEEIRALCEEGVEVEIISVLEPGPGPVQQVSEGLLPFCSYAPHLLSFELWRAQLYFLFSSGWRYLSLLYVLLRSPYPKQPFALFAKRMVIFLKAVAVAYRLRTSPVDLFHAHFAWLSGAAAWICARLLERPYTVTAHAYDLFASADLLALVAGEANQVVAISEYNRQFLIDRQICTADQVSVVHCGIDLRQFSVSTRDPKLPTTEAPLRILSVGSLQPKKGHEYLVESCHLLHTRCLPFTCTIIGGGPGAEKLRRLVEKYGLQAHVTIAGARPNHEIVLAYGQHDIFVLAAVVAPNGDQDGVPVVMMEAGAAGLPLVSTRVSGIPELVRHGRTGLLVPPNDATALAEAISQLAGQPQQRLEMGNNARTLVSLEYNVAHNATQLAELFRSIVAHRDPR